MKKQFLLLLSGVLIILPLSGQTTGYLGRPGERGHTSIRS
jgi:hypothetical protein